MKKLLVILSSFFLVLGLNAQTEDEVYIGKGKTFRNYTGTAIIIPDLGKNAKPATGQTAITGVVVGMCKSELCCNKKPTSCSMDVQYADGNIVTVGTGDAGFTIPRKIEGRSIIVEGKDASQIAGGRKRKDLIKEYRQDIQFAATGIKVID